jgi:hypothetical protein
MRKTQRKRRLERAGKRPKVWRIPGPLLQDLANQAIAREQARKLLKDAPLTPQMRTLGEILLGQAIAEDKVRVIEGEPSGDVHCWKLGKTCRSSKPVNLAGKLKYFCEVCGFDMT